MNPVRPLSNNSEKMKPNEGWFYTYVIRCAKLDIFYTGTTNDLSRRLEQHNNGQVYYTKNKRPLRLVYFEACLDKKDAYRRERYLKTGMGKRYINNRIRGGLTG